MTAIETLNEIISVLVGAITELGKGIGTGISSVVTSMMYTTNGSTTTLSAWFVCVLVFAGISLAVGLTRLVYNFVTSMGGSH